MTLQGSCHCGQIAFEVDGQPDQAMDCNCSLCQKRGALHWFVPRGALFLKTPEANLSLYQFASRKLQHYFCAQCGCAPFSEGAGPDGQAIAAVNVRCLDNFDLSAVKIVPFDGRSR